MYDDTNTILSFLLYVMAFVMLPNSLKEGSNRQSEKIHMYIKCILAAMLCVHIKLRQKTDQELKYKTNSKKRNTNNIFNTCQV